ncbi:MAG: hypothetical protein ACKO4M_12035, partial [Betaproteobacteria bacterium]
NRRQSQSKQAKPQHTAKARGKVRASTERQSKQPKPSQIDKAILAQNDPAMEVRWGLNLRKTSAGELLAQPARLPAS